MHAFGVAVIQSSHHVLGTKIDEQPLRETFDHFTYIMTKINLVSTSIVTPQIVTPQIVTPQIVNARSSMPGSPNSQSGSNASNSPRAGDGMGLKHMASWLYSELPPLGASAPLSEAEMLARAPLSDAEMLLSDEDINEDNNTLIEEFRDDLEFALITNARDAPATTTAKKWYRAAAGFVEYASDMGRSIRHMDDSALFQARNDYLDYRERKYPEASRKPSTRSELQSRIYAFVRWKIIGDAKVQSRGKQRVVRDHPLFAGFERSLQRKIASQGLNENHFANLKADVRTFLTEVSKKSNIASMDEQTLEGTITAYVDNKHPDAGTSSARTKNRMRYHLKKFSDWMKSPEKSIDVEVAKRKSAEELWPSINEFSNKAKTNANLDQFDHGDGDDIYPDRPPVSDSLTGDFWDKCDLPDLP